MGQILGRSDDMLIIRGVNLFHTQVEAVLEGFIDLSSNYQLIVKNEGKMDEVEVKVEIGNELWRQLAITSLDNEVVQNHDRLSLIHRALQKKIKDNIGLTMNIQLLNPGAIPRSEGGKLNRIVDVRKK
jgi:phenylacetate-CoA ligase